MKKIILLFFACCICGTFAFTQTRYYVRATANGANNGQSWSDAFIDLQAALQLAQTGDEVWVAEGIYRPTTGTDRSISFEPKSGVHILGGFAGTENNANQRDWTVHPTILTGDIGISGDSTDNTYNVMYLHQPDSNTIVDGLTLRDGVANGFNGNAVDRSKCGGGLYIMGKDWEAYPTIRNCTFFRNTAQNYGGGTMVNGTGDGSVAPLFINCIITNNNAGLDGGGMARFGASWVDRAPDMDSCIFMGNYAARNGGGLYLVDADRSDDYQMSRLHFIENKSLGFGAGAMINLGRLDESTNFRLSGCEFRKNASAGRNAAIYITPRQFLSANSIELLKCSFIENDTLPVVGQPLGTSLDGIISMLLLSNNPLSEIKIIDCPIKNNLNKSGGHVISAEGGYGTLFNIEKCTFSGNLASRAIVNLASSKIKILDTKTCGNISNLSFELSYGDTATITNCSIIETKVSNQPNSRLLKIINGLYFYVVNSLISERNSPEPVTESMGGSSSLTVTIQNSSVLGNRFAQALALLKIQNNQGAHISHSYFDTLNCSTLPSNIICGPGILTGIDPLFVNPDSNNYCLQPCSPLLNAGNNDYVLSATDLAGLPRIQGGIVDIGAYEAQGPALTQAPQVTPSCPGGASGAVEPEVQDACLPVAYNWQSDVSSGNQLTGLPAGNYQFTITDAKGQTGAFSVNIPVGNNPELLPLSTALVCGDTIGGSATAALNPATPPLQYLWAGGSTDSLRTGLAAGSYSLTLTDANGCSTSGTVQVDKTGSLSVDIDVQEISCNGAADGAFTVLPGNGKAPYKWLWESGANSPMIGPLGPGNYTGTLTDALGCTIQWVLPLGQPGPLQSNAVVTNANDSTAANGRIELLPNGGTTPYTILWSTGATGPVLDSLLPGIYTATLTDANDCMLVETYTVGVTSGTNEAGVVYGAQLYPNPAVESVWLILNRPAKAQLPVRVLNSAGQEVLRGQLPVGARSWLFQVADLPRGLYFVQIQGAVRKLVLR